MMFEKYVLCFERKKTMTAEGLAAKIKYSPELGDNVTTAEEHIHKSVYNPNLNILPFLDGKMPGIDKPALRSIIARTRLKYFTSFDVDYTVREFPVICDHYALPIFDETEEAIVLRYITKNKGFRNIKKTPFVESEWEKKKAAFLPEVEEMYSQMYSRFMAEK